MGFCACYVARDDVHPPLHLCCSCHTAHGLPTSCKQVKDKLPLAPSGMYQVYLDGSGVVSVYCDMETDGGGWMVLWSTSGADNEHPFTSDTHIDLGDTSPLSGGVFNLNRMEKARLVKQPSETLIRRSTSWLRVSHAPIPANFGSAAAHPVRHVFPVSITASNAAGPVTEAGFMGVSTSSVTGGGDFTVSLAPVVSRSAHASADLVSAGCSDQLVWSYSSAQLDSDAKYGSSVGLAAWSAEGTCDGAEGGGVAMMIAVRELSHGE